VKFLRHGLYPATDLKTESSKYLDSPVNVEQWAKELEQFMLTADKKAGFNNGYLPQLDFLGPMLFAPLHCSDIKAKNIYASPMIAYVENDNPI